MQVINFVLFRVLAIVGAVLAALSIYKRSFSNGTYATFIVIQGMSYGYTGWFICIIACFTTLAALLLTRSDTQ